MEVPKPNMLPARPRSPRLSLFLLSKPALETMSTCVTHKKMYATQEIAEDVLIEAWTRYDYTPGNGPVTVYKCPDCNQYHLTSTGEMNTKLVAALKDGKISRQKEADRWMRKFKHR